MLHHSPIEVFFVAAMWCLSGQSKLGVPLNTSIVLQASGLCLLGLIIGRNPSVSRVKKLAKRQT